MEVYTEHAFKALLSSRYRPTTVGMYVPGTIVELLEGERDLYLLLYSIQPNEYTAFSLRTDKVITLDTQARAKVVPTALVRLEPKPGA